jgi:hypothetical protein
VDLKKADNSWAPDDIPSLINWFDVTDSSTIDLVDGRVSEWRDTVSSERLVQSTVSNQPLLDGAFIGETDPTGRHLRLDTLFPVRSLPVTEVFVLGGMRPLTGLDGLGLIIQVGDTSNLRQSLAVLPSNDFPPFIQGKLVMMNGAEMAFDDNRVMPALRAPYVVMMSLAAGTTVNWDFSVNALPGRRQPATTVATTDHEIRRVGLGLISQYIVLPGAIDVNRSNVEKIEGWAAHRFGFAQDLPAGHPYRDAPPTS